ncbi:MAG: hypothetical protein V3U84_01270 [Thiotrichaceae bacterium]
MNKHQRLALIVAPFLLIGGYIAADYYDVAQQKVAMAEKAGRLTLVDGCNLQTNSCTLQKGGLELQLKAVGSGKLLLTSNEALEGATLAIGDDEPKGMLKSNDNKHWEIQLPENAIKATTMKLVTSINQVFYFAEISL